MRVIAFVCLDHFYAQARGKTTEEWVLHHSGNVLDVSAGALARGIAIGMGHTEARTMLAGSGHIEAWEPQPYQTAREKWLNAVAVFSDAIEPYAQHAALVDFSGHPKPQSTAKHMLSALQGLGFMPRLGLASTKFVARLAAGRGDTDGLGLKAPAKFVAMLPVETLPVPPEVAIRLRLLGYRTIGQVAAVPRELLRPVFGDVALEIERACSGRGDARVKALYPAQSVTARFMFEGPVETLDIMERGLSELAKCLALRLGEDDGYSETLELCIEFEDGRITAVTRTFARSIHTAREAFAALKLMLAAPPQKPIVGMQARLKEVKRSCRVQAPLTMASICDSTERSRIALAHVKEAFGDQTVQIGSDLNCPRWKEVRRAYHAVNGWTW